MTSSGNISRSTTFKSKGTTADEGMLWERIARKISALFKSYRVQLCLKSNSLLLKARHPQAGADAVPKTFPNSQRGDDWTVNPCTL